MNISQYKEAIMLCRKAELPLMAWGAGGIGKTTGAKQVAEELGINFIAIQGPILTPVDLLGIPNNNNNKMEWLRPPILPEDGEGIILIDELPDSTPTMQKAYYQLVLEKRVQTHVIPKEWFVMGAGNRPEDKGFSTTLPAPLITRFVHCGVYCDNPDFTDRTVEKVDIDIDDFITYIVDKFHPFVVAFLKFRPEFIYKNQATPRTWEYVSKLLKVEKNYNNFVLKELIKGTVGTAIGIEFNSFISLATKMPSIKSILMSPETSPIPDDPDVKYAVVTGLLQLMKEDKYKDNAIKYIVRFPKEYQFFFFTQARNKYNTIISNPYYIKWANENSEYLI